MAATYAARGGNASLVSLLAASGLSVSPAVVLAALGAALAAILRRRPAGVAVESALVLLVVTLASPAVWAHTFLLVAPGLALAAEAVASRIAAGDLRDPRLRSRRLLATLGLAYATLVFLQPGQFSMRMEGVGLAGTALAVLGPVVLATILLGEGRPKSEV
jgi:hypothetical protein